MPRKADKILEPIKCGPYTLGFERVLVMGILNVTPDSFSDCGRFLDVDRAVEHAIRMAGEGADIIDVGGESTRPGSETVSVEEELGRVEGVVERLVDEVKVPISIDTYKPEVAARCIELGAHIINDVTGLRNTEMIGVAAAKKVPVVMMHMKGEPKTMQENPAYRDAVMEIKQFFANRISEARKAGVKDIIIDPGIGFGKRLEHNLEILKRLEELKEMGCPILVGLSRKSFIGQITGLPADDRLEGTLAAVAVSVMNGANIVRVHDVRECKRAVMVAGSIMRA